MGEVEVEDNDEDRGNRRELAERWRLLGEKLRARSPRAFSKLLELLVTSAVDEDGDTGSTIDSVYQIH